MRSSLRGCCALLVAMAALGPSAAFAQPAATPEPPTTMASGVLVDLQTKKVLWAKDDRAQRAPASLTKILTALTVLDRAHLEDTAVISSAARNARGGRMYAEEGWTFTIQDLLWGLMLQSGNDAAITLAEKVSPDGTVEGFMKLANAKAVSLGATDSSFQNPHGLDQPGHMTTARDLAIITGAAMENPVFVQIVSSKTHVVPWGDGQPHMFINHNKMLWRAPGAIGVKTGFTEGAGNCLISAMNRDGHTLVAVVLGTPNHYAESTALFDWGFANLEALRANSTSDIRKPVSSDAFGTGPNGLDVTESSTSGVPRLLLPALAMVVTVTLGIAFRQRLIFQRP
ncbi:MAG: D-alanyl-D-alanine carboxypeptidase family protein [Actinomycetota bacterium]